MKSEARKSPTIAAKTSSSSPCSSSAPIIDYDCLYLIAERSIWAASTPEQCNRWRQVAPSFRRSKRLKKLLYRKLLWEFQCKIERCFPDTCREGIAGGGR